MIEEIEFTAAPFEGAPALRVKAAPVTVLVGPNNGGKSQALRDIEQLLSGAQAGLVVQAVTSTMTLSTEEIVGEIVRLGGRVNGMLVTSPPGLMPMANGAVSRAIDPVDDDRQHEELRCILLRSKTLRLDGTTRLQLTDPQPGGNLRMPAANIPRLLVDSPDLRRRLRKLVEEAFGLHLIVTSTDEAGSFELRLSPRTPEDDDEELGFTARALAFRAQSKVMREYSDGVRAYAGILAAQFAPHYACILVDEPEAFLHPTLARRLGAQLARLAKTETRTVVAATHSADFLVGCIEAGTPVDVVRLTYSKQGKASARRLPSTELDALARTPVLRSANVLSALFHQGAVVCEGESDRPFYQEINYRLTETGEGVPHSMFLSVNGKGGSPTVLAPLRRLGVPAAAVVDFDATKGADSFGKLLDAAMVPDATRIGIGQARGELWAAIEKADLKDKAKKHGLSALAAQDRRAAADLIEQVAGYGVFVVDVGEVEGWLGHLGVAGQKIAWATAMLERLGSDPSSPDYVKPANDDVWAFMRKIARWVSDPDRKGTAG